jgi:outer membrane receptor for ferrienterochelin and colicins
VTETTWSCRACRFFRRSIVAFAVGILPLGFPILAAGQEESRRCAVQGTIRDATGLPLPGVVLTVTGRPESVTSDAEGRYCLPDLPVARVAIEASLDAFQKEMREVNVPAEGSPLAVDLTLQPSRIREQVVVTATRTSRRLDDVPVRTEVVDTALIRAIGARTLADAVEYTTGVRVESNCQNCNFTQIRLLGLDGPYTQILMDGQPVISSLAQVYGIEQIPSRMIERIEVVKGGGSALYGPGSVGGVINIISREAARRGGLFETRIDMTDGRPSYSASGSFDWLSTDRQTLGTGFLQLDEVKPLDVSGDGFTEVSRRELHAGGGRVNRYLLGGRAKLTAEVTRFVEDRRGGDALGLPPQEATIAEWINTRRTAASTTWFHTVSRAFDYRFTVAVADTSRDSYYGTDRDPNAFGTTENLLAVVDAQVNEYAGRHTVSWGGQFSSDDLLDRQPAYDRLTDATYRNAGIFVQDDWAFAKGWEVILGVRGDKHSSIDRVIASPRAALMYSPREALDIRASVARGFRAPQAFDEDLHLSSVGGDVRFIRLDSNLREETSTNYMLGAEWKPEAGRGQALVEINAFSTSLDDLFHVREADDPATDAQEFLKVNFGQARVYGVEMNAGWGMGDQFVLQGGMVFQRARFGDAEPDFGSRDFFRTPTRYGNLTVTWRTARWGEWFAGLRYTGPMKAPHYAGYIEEDRLETTPSFATVDASLSYPVYAEGQRRLMLTVGAKNIGNAYQRDIDQGPLRDSDYVYGPRFPRSVMVGLRAEF